ncbi:NAD(P)H-hydrate dehydratase [Salinilacihabitans rarus]|uniref:NAD(P)H-hydrate dehydratase n=1 Tax=Salinilacihabitans rarus TaxID=2961596 RepID=UPI0020C9194D|nr:NAD(P)H-hydrate dehydratase [Salinilacihabitans rarus]
MERLQRTLSGTEETTGADNGGVGVVGGSVDYPNQPALVCRAALRTGSDDARALVSETIHPIVAGHEPNALVSGYAGERFTAANVDRAREVAAAVDALVIGPGLADADPAAVREVVAAVDVPTVVDALAIDPVLDGEVDLSSAVLTPSGAEDDPIVDAYGSLEAFSTETGAAVALTGDVDVIVAGGERVRNETGTSALSVAGTGDTLTGIVASLLGQGMDRLEAAELGAWILGKAGELATADRGPGVVATDVVDRLPDAIR